MALLQISDAIEAKPRRKIVDALPALYQRYCELNAEMDALCEKFDFIRKGLVRRNGDIPTGSTAAAHWGSDPLYQNLQHVSGKIKKNEEKRDETQDEIEATEPVSPAGTLAKVRFALKYTEPGPSEEIEYTLKTARLALIDAESTLAKLVGE